MLASTMMIVSFPNGSTDKAESKCDQKCGNERDIVQDDSAPRRTTKVSCLDLHHGSYVSEA